MKKVLTYLLFLIFVLTLNTCTKSSNTPKISKVTISGKIDNFEKYSDEFVVVNVYVNNIIKYSETHSSHINKDGSFLVQFNLINQQDISLVYGNKYITLFVEPGDSLHLQIDATQLLERGIDNNSISISSTSKNINNILIDYKPKFSTFLHQTYVNDFDPKGLAKDMSANDYKSYLYERINKNIVYLNDYIRQNNISNELFEKWARLEIEFRCLERMLAFQKYKARFNKINQKDVKLPENYYNFLQKYSPNATDNLMCSAFHYYLHKYIELKRLDFYTQNNLSHSDSSFIKYLEATLKQEDSFVRDVTLSQIFYRQMDANIKLIEPFYEAYLTTINNAYLKNIVLDKYNLLYVNQNIKNKPDNVSLNIFIEKDSLLNDIIEKHKNKVIYIDFWATWCGACKMEFPYSNKLYEAYPREKIAFVYLCNRSTKESWQHIISTQNLSGDHYLLSNKQYEILSSYFQINGIPHYVLINKNGVLIDKDAKRPSNTNLISDLNDLL